MLFGDAIRIGFLFLVGVALCMVVIWYIVFLVQEIRGTGQIVIDQFTVVRNDGKGDDDLGKALAQMLQVRLQSLVVELQEAQVGLTTEVSASAVTEVRIGGPVGDVRLWTQTVALQTRLLQPVDMKLSVAGVDVGGLIPWIQRGLTNQRTIHFTIYMQADAAEIFGSVGGMGLADNGLRLAVEGANGKPPSLTTIVDRLAHEIMRRYLAQDTSNKLELLDPTEFFSLTEVLVSAAEANRKAILGRLSPNEFADLVPKIAAIADRVPNWPELGYLTARLADSAKDSPKALIYYQRVLPQFESVKRPELVELITLRISSLTGKSATPAPAQASGPLPPALDHSDKITLVRDSGNEGSVVGQAMAAALEFQIAKATKMPRQISARYIYYAARKAAGYDMKTDTGAQISDAIAVLGSEGAVQESVWPYRPGEFDNQPPAAVGAAERFRITGARELKTLNDLKQALNENGPAIAGISVFPGMMTTAVSKSGIVPLPAKSASAVGGHAVVIVGYDDQTGRVKFVNSWGANWGDKGFGYLPYEYINRYMSDAWTFKLATN